MADAPAGQGPLYKVAENLYIGGIDSIDRTALSKGDVRAVLSLLRNASPLEGVEQLIVEIDDLAEEDLLSELPRCMDFIYDNVQKGPVLVHWHVQAGTSRSVAVVVAYLMATRKMTLGEAAAVVGSARGGIAPNEGFLAQLELWERMGGRLDTKDPRYRLYCMQRMAERRMDGRLSSADFITGLEGGDGAEKVYRCKKCRKQLFVEKNIIPHEPGAGQESFKWRKRDDPITQKNKEGDDSCTSYFIQPIRWMARDIVGEAVYDGRLTCDQCDTRLGNFNWSGSQCSCGRWISPAFEVHKKKVDGIFKR